MDAGGHYRAIICGRVYNYIVYCYKLYVLSYYNMICCRRMVDILPSEWLGAKQVKVTF